MTLNYIGVGLWNLVYDDTIPSADSPTSTHVPEPVPSSSVDDDIKELSPEHQKIFDAAVQKRLAKQKTQNQETIAQLEKLKSTQKMTEDERVKLQKQISQLESITLTDKELTAKQRKEDNDKFENQVNVLQSESDTWKGRFHQSTIQRAILDAASRTETRAFNPSQVVKLLVGDTSLVETATEDGQPTGEFVARVKFSGRDSKGAGLEMDLTVPEAVSEMLKMPDLYGNLFESGLKNGVGGNNIPGTGPVTDAALSSQENYREARKKIVEGV